MLETSVPAGRAAKCVAQAQACRQKKKPAPQGTGLCRDALDGRLSGASALISTRNSPWLSANPSSLTPRNSWPAGRARHRAQVADAERRPFADPADQRAGEHVRHGAFVAQRPDLRRRRRSRCRRRSPLNWTSPFALKVSVSPRRTVDAGGRPRLPGRHGDRPGRWPACRSSPRGDRSGRTREHDPPDFAGRELALAACWS